MSAATQPIILRPDDIHHRMEWKCDNALTEFSHRSLLPGNFHSDNEKATRQQ